MRLVRIEDVTEIKPFDCGDSELNNNFLPLVNEQEHDTLPMYYDLKPLI